MKGANFNTKTAEKEKVAAEILIGKSAMTDLIAAEELT